MKACFFVYISVFLIVKSKQLFWIRLSCGGQNLPVCLFALLRCATKAGMEITSYSVTYRNRGSAESFNRDILVVVGHMSVSA